MVSDVEQILIPLLYICTFSFEIVCWFSHLFIDCIICSLHSSVFYSFIYWRNYLPIFETFYPTLQTACLLGWWFLYSVEAFKFDKFLFVNSFSNVLTYWSSTEDHYVCLALNMFFPIRLTLKYQVIKRSRARWKYIYIYI